MVGQHRVGIGEERGEIVGGGSEAHALIIDEHRLVFYQHDVGGLEVPMDEDAGGIEQEGGDCREFLERGLNFFCG